MFSWEKRIAAHLWEHFLEWGNWLWQSKNVCFFPIFWCWLFLFWWSSRRSFFTARRIYRISNCITPLKNIWYLKEFGKKSKKIHRSRIMSKPCGAQAIASRRRASIFEKCFKYFLFASCDLIRSWCFTGKLYKTIRDMLFEEIKPKILFLKNAFPE